jgi:hypothetical protein
VFRVYSVYLTHLTKLIQIRTEWITTSEPRMEQTRTTDASDIPDLEVNLTEHEVSNNIDGCGFSRGGGVALRNN